MFLSRGVHYNGAFRGLLRQAPVALLSSCSILHRTSGSLILPIFAVKRVGWGDAFVDSLAPLAFVNTMRMLVWYWVRGWLWSATRSGEKGGAVPKFAIIRSHLRSSFVLLCGSIAIPSHGKVPGAEH